MSRLDPAVFPAKARLRVLDATRGWALVMMIFIHGMALFLDSHASRRDYAELSVLFFFAKVAAPLFIWVFGMTMAYVYWDALADPIRFERLRRHLWTRAGWVFLSRQFLVLVVDFGEGQSPGYILRRLLYVQTGPWIEILNFYTILLLVAPWLLRAWRVAPLLYRLATMVFMYGLGWLLAHVPVPDQGFALKNILVGYPAGTLFDGAQDTFPVFQLSFFFFGGLLAGEYLGVALRARAYSGLIRGGVLLAALSLGLSLLLGGQSPQHYITAIAYDRFKYPPNLAYLCYGLAMAVAVTLGGLWLEVICGVDRWWLRMIERLGRNSLFTFNIQYVLLFTVCGQGLGLLRHQSLLRSFAGTALVLVATLVSASGWDEVKRHL